MRGSTVVCLGQIDCIGQGEVGDALSLTAWEVEKIEGPEVAVDLQLELVEIGHDATCSFAESSSRPYSDTVMISPHVTSFDDRQHTVLSPGRRNSENRRHV